MYVPTATKHIRDAIAFSKAWSNARNKEEENLLSAAATRAEEDVLKTPARDIHELTLKVRFFYRTARANLEPSADPLNAKDGPEPDAPGLDEQRLLWSILQDLERFDRQDAAA